MALTSSVILNGGIGVCIGQVVDSDRLRRHLGGLDVLGASRLLLLVGCVLHAWDLLSLFLYIKFNYICIKEDPYIGRVDFYIYSLTL